MKSRNTPHPALAQLIVDMANLFVDEPRPPSPEEIDKEMTDEAFRTGSSPNEPSLPEPLLRFEARFQSRGVTSKVTARQARQRLEARLQNKAAKLGVERSRLPHADQSLFDRYSQAYQSWQLLSAIVDTPKNSSAWVFLAVPVLVSKTNGETKVVEVTPISWGLKELNEKLSLPKKRRVGKRHRKSEDENYISLHEKLVRCEKCRRFFFYERRNQRRCGRPECRRIPSRKLSDRPARQR